jgi:hypothetical protein
MIYPALNQWFRMPIPEEYSRRRPAEDLLCWTEELREKLRPGKLGRVIEGVAAERNRERPARPPALKPAEHKAAVRKEWAAFLGDVEPAANPKLIEGRAEDVPGGTLARFALESEPGIVVPLFLVSPKGAKGKSPVVVMVAQGGKAGFLKERGDAIAAFLKAGVAVCLVDVRGTGETRPGDGSPGWRGSRTTISQTELILGRTVLGNQLRDLRAVVRWLQARPELDGTRTAVWGDSFAEPNAGDASSLVVPLDAPDLPAHAEPGGAMLAELAALYEDGVRWVYARGGYGPVKGPGVWESPYLYVPHESVVPQRALSRLGAATDDLGPIREATVDARNRRTPWVDRNGLPTTAKPESPARTAGQLAGRMGEKSG